MSSTVLSEVQAQARATVDAYEHFISPNIDFHGTSSTYTLAQEDFITYRDPYNPNADAGGFTVGPGYIAADTAIGINDAYERRAVYLEALYGITPETGKGGNDQLEYLSSLGSYESIVRGLANVNPSTLTPLPGESGQPNSAWVDPQTGAVAVYYNGERLYVNADWRNYEFNNNGWANLVPSYLARIHDTTATEDKAALVFMPHDSTTVQSDGNLSGTIGQPWVVRYDNWLIMGNPSSSSTTLKMPADTGQAVDLITRNKYNLGSTITVAAGQSVVLILANVTSVEPVVNGTYTMTNLHSSLLLDDPESSKSNGTQMVPNSSSGSTTQQWIFTYNGSGYYTIQDAYSGLVLDNPGGQNTPGTILEQWGANGGTNQLWQLIASGGGYIFVNKFSGWIIEDANNSMSAGSPIDLWSADTGNNQTWQLTSVTAVPQPLANGTYNMTDACSGLSLDNNGSGSSGARLIQNTPSGSNNQKWIFTYK